MRELDPAGLPRGTVVGPWRVVSLRGQGTYGAVYRAVRVGQEGAAPVALKVAVYAQDPRFEREAELLRRIRHPSVPGLRDQGRWRQPTGATYPYLAMEWIEGMSLYDWARVHNPSSRRLFQLLAQLASALAATHAATGVHRDVKGDNVLVRHADQRAVLMDFGVGIHEGASPLTPPPMTPGTPAYRPPEAWLSAPRFQRLGIPYVAGPPDDLYALGITAFRLVTGGYPPPMKAREDEAGLWHMDGAPPSPLAINPRVAPRLNALILRMLSMKPEERGTAGELAEALEHAARSARTEADQPLFTPETQPPPTWSREDAAFAAVFNSRLHPELLGNAARLRALRRRRRVRGGEARCRSAHWQDAPTERAAPSANTATWRLLLIAATVMVFPLLCGRGAPHAPDMELLAVAEVAPDVDKPDAGPVAVGDTTLTAPEMSLRSSSGRNVIALDTPPKPRPGQLKPDVSGRCPRKTQVAINGGCWFDVNVDLDACEDDDGFVYKNRCYLPAFPNQRQPTSTPQDSR